MGEVVLDMQRFDRIGRITGDEVDVEAGVPIAMLQAALARSDAFYPPAPTFDGAFAGGVVSTNAAGAATFKYGTTRDWVRRLTVVLASGDVLDIARGETATHPDGWFEVETAGAVRRVPAPAYRMPDVAKCSAGYFAEPEMDLIDLFIGSEGTLGIVTEITFAVVTPAPRIALVWIPLPSEPDAVALAGSLRDAALDCWRTDGASGVDIAAIEHLDARSLQIVREDGAARRLGVALPEATEVALLAQMELPAGSAAAADAASAYAEIAGALGDDAPDLPLVRLCRRLAEAGVLDRAEIALPADTRRQAQLTAVREAAPEGVNRRVGEAKRRSGAAIAKTAADMIVPFDRFEESLGRFRDAFAARQLDYAIWGHISDGNVHPNVIPRTIEDVRAWPRGDSRMRARDRPSWRIAAGGAWRRAEPGQAGAAAAVVRGRGHQPDARRQGGTRSGRRARAGGPVPMMWFFIHWLTTGIALGVAAWILPGVTITSMPALAVAALVLGLVNSIVKPILLVLTLPLTVMTLGVFYLVVNGVAFALAAWIVPGFQVASFLWAVAGAVLVGLMSMFIGSFRKRERPPFRTSSQGGRW